MYSKLSEKDCAYDHLIQKKNSLKSLTAMFANCIPELVTMQL